MEPTKADYLAQIDADLKAETEPSADLKERRKRVAAAPTAAKAKEAYFGHLDELRAPADDADAPAE